jgi:hypothetical protein
MSTIAESAIPAPPSIGHGAASASYLGRPLPIWIIFAAFFLLSVPLCALMMVDSELVDRWYLKAIFMWILGMTHFLITLTVYMQSANLRHFNSTWKNRLLYFAVPIGIFLLFDLYTALRIAVTMPLLAAAFQWSVRFLDFHHVNRQSFGVLQMFKGRSGVTYPAWMKKAESYYFWVLTGLLYLTFASGGAVKPDNPLMAIGLVALAGLVVALAVGFAVTWRGSTDRRALAAPLTYFTLQSASAALGIVSTAMWVFCLAMHYVEYHVLMLPRCFDTPLDPDSRVDRVFGRLRRSKAVFYGLLLALAGGATYLTWYAMGEALLESAGSGSSSAYLALIAIFDGIFVFHYFVESLIWKFSQPFYRRTLVPLYFGPGRSG